MAKREPFSMQFELRALEPCEPCARQATEVARELGIRRNQLHKRQAELQSRDKRQAFREPGRLVASDEEA